MAHFEPKIKKIKEEAQHPAETHPGGRGPGTPRDASGPSNHPNRNPNLWPFDLRVNDCREPAMDHIYCLSTLGLIAKPVFLLDGEQTDGRNWAPIHARDSWVSCKPKIGLYLV